MKHKSLYFLVIVALLAPLFYTTPAFADDGSVQRIVIRRTLDGSTEDVTVYNNGSWVNRTVYFDAAYGIAVTIYAQGGSADWYYQLINDAGYNGIWHGASLSRIFYPPPPIESNYSAIVDGNWAGGVGAEFYVREVVPACDTPGTPGLVSPGNGTTTDENTPGFDWNSASYADEYQLQVDNDSNFSSSEINVTPSSSSYTPSSPLVDNTYYWRVRGHNTSSGCDVYGSWSSVWSVTVDAPPDPPPLTGPPNGSTTSSSTPTFDWMAVSGASEYQLQVDNDSNFSSPEIDIYRPQTQSSSYTPASPLSNDTYYWRVRARDAAYNWSTWSPVWSITINAGPTCDTPGTPGLVSPGNGTTTDENTPGFDWNSASYADEYQLQVDNDSNFSSPEINVTPSSSSYTPGSPLLDNTYYWRVRGHNTSSGCDVYGSWSSVWSVTVDTREVDLSVLTQRPYVSYGSQAIEPYTTTLGICVQNLGEADAHDVIVDFYNGHPNSGEWIAATTIDTIVGYGEDYAFAEWYSAHDSLADVYVRVRLQSSGLETYLTNNITQSSTEMEVYYADFTYDPDTFNFPNWSMTWLDFLDEMIAYHDARLPENIPREAWRYILGPMIYANYASGGHCYGMAQASIVLWDTPLERPNGKPTYQLDGSEAKPAIRDHHARQIIRIIADRQQNSNPNSAYDRLLARIRDQRRPTILSVFRNCEQDTCGHSVTAYKIVEAGNTKKVFVYDNNEPMDGVSDYAEVATFDTNANTFTYDSYNEVYTEDPVRDIDEYFASVIQDIYAGMSEQLATSGLAQVFLDSPATALLTDQHGRRIGFAGGVFVNEIPGATMEDFEGAYRFKVPAEQAYSVTTTGTGSGTLTLSFQLPLDEGLMQEVVYTDVPVSPGSETTTHLSQITRDWAMELDSGQTRQPDLERKVKTTSNPSTIYLPAIYKN